MARQSNQRVAAETRCASLKGETMPDQYNEATQPGSTFPNRTTLPSNNGAPLPSLVARGVPLPSFAGVLGRASYPVGSFTAPPNTTGGPGAPNGAVIHRPTPAIGPSVVGTVVSATPVANIATALRELPHAARRPLIPAGLRERAADAMPPGMRQRATVWARAVARWRSHRPTTGGRISRE